MYGRTRNWKGKSFRGDGEDEGEAGDTGLICMQALRLDEIRTHQWNILRCSAMTGENLQEGLAWVVADAKKRLFLY